jgi:ubiquinone/menaquinone biosynthesis C-methylase UbiE
MDRRQRAVEWMDEPTVDAQLLNKSLRYIRTLNSLLGYTRSTLSHFDHFSKSWRPGQTITVLDVATGSADVPQALVAWGDQHGFNIHVTAIDLHDRTIQLAANRKLDPRIELVRANAAELPFDAGSFDYAMTSMFLHHIDEPTILQVLHEMDRVARRGVVAADVLRERFALIWIHLFTLTANPIVRHDAIVSVKQALTRDEILSLSQQTGLEYLRYFRHFGHRFVLAGEK